MWFGEVFAVQRLKARNITQIYYENPFPNICLTKGSFLRGSGWVMWASLFNSVQGGKNWLRTSMRCASVGRPYFSRKLRCFAWKDEPTKCRQWENNIGLDLGNPGVTPVQPVDDSRTLKLNHKYFMNFIQFVFGYTSNGYQEWNGQIIPNLRLFERDSPTKRTIHSEVVGGLYVSP